MYLICPYIFHGYTPVFEDPISHIKNLQARNQRTTSRRIEKLKCCKKPFRNIIAWAEKPLNSENCNMEYLTIIAKKVLCYTFLLHMPMIFNLTYSKIDVVTIFLKITVQLLVTLAN